MLMSVRVGTNDLPRARAFYDATFVALGGEPAATPATLPIAMYVLPGGPRFIVGGARDGAAATHANGGTILFTAPDDAGVDAWYEAGIAAGGSSEGEPGPRPQARDRYGAYLRDPDGNKLGCYTGSMFG